MLIGFNHLLKLAKRSWHVRHGFSAAIPQFLAAFCSAWVSLQLLNRTDKSQPSRQPLQHAKTVHEVAKLDSLSTTDGKCCGQLPSSQAGRSLDLTFFAVTRSLETVIGFLWARRSVSRIKDAKWTPLEAMISRAADPIVFAASSSVVMWAWFYYPDRLPRAYNRWIKEAAQVDSRLVEVLRRARTGEFAYGREAGHDGLLESFCIDLNLPVTWGNPYLTIPIPCEVVHSGLGASCHWHSAMRFSRAFKFAFASYFPIQIILKATKKPSWRALVQALQEALRSSAFLGAFVGLFYYGVCLARTILGPKLLQSRGVTPQMWDRGLCVRAGCILCGSSILIEAAKRRQEMAYFVAPKAVATYFPRRYNRKAGSILKYLR